MRFPNKQQSCFYELYINTQCFLQSLALIKCSLIYTVKWSNYTLSTSCWQTTPECEAATNATFSTINTAAWVSSPQRGELEPLPLDAKQI